MPTPPISEKFKLQFNDSLCTCDVCGRDVASLNEGRGDFLLCYRHNNWLGWFKAWRLDRKGF